ncbi:PucR family transcriptional regulator [Nocardia cyriacigeorgica]|uniref:PucR family transcriptional regulator n=2 Tax=Nocardia cyriacigeorgica TaxID=135487 RepID=A0A6P1CY70_9NOCA|nr:helix-turn-helix domain-containing protein [Nocardia cyriacigeorgica]MBF6084821.1 helix-turn-helix domain-containing protein [Nocardia cyriacigeorgica]MBF6287783.1 helix-turn-helix domain-containing protein [Nocardia cyriacigeorgica]MBF6428297.1 helix-turn-helix domain-containing protein [Nocardia cyriacigeorgica]NEW35165.1 PucR family transcriptional regulator [Nocardia cyriacigeorgica]CCF63171.1 putative transcriptional regulator [Nocardia cyriacigeorgica GUH-2]
MAVDSAMRAALTVSGQPMSAPLQDVRSLSRQMVGHFVENVVPCGTLPGDAIYGDVTTITRVCLELAVSMLDGRDIPEKTRRLENAAAGWAREGVPIDTIHHAIHEGFKLGFDLVVSNASVTDYSNLVDGAKLVVEMLDRMTSAISMAYVRELRAVVSEHHTAVHTLTSALLGGHSTSTMARECGIEIAESYTVLAMAIPAHPDEADATLDGKVVARRKLRRVQAELATRCGERALSLLSVDGGTILIPSSTFSDDELDELVAQLSRAAQVPITAAVVESPTDKIPGAADQAHELLDMVQRLRCVRGLYRFDDMALEYQLTRPGPGREYLGSLLDPLDDHPELLETLQRHISNNLNRQRTARVMHIHTNTIDYRLKRIAQLTGFDPTQPSGLWYLRSALVARTYRSS